MSSAARVALITLLLWASCSSAVVFFKNHRYGTNLRKPYHIKSLNGVHSQMMRERQKDLVRFTESEKETRRPLSTEFPTKEVVDVNDIVGVLPSKIFKGTPGRRYSNPIARKPPAKDADSSESQINLQYGSTWNHFTTHESSINGYKHAGLYDKPYGKVRVHTYRGPSKDHWTKPKDAHHGPERVKYAPWGYYVKQPVVPDHRKFHAPLELSFHYQ